MEEIETSQQVLSVLQASAHWLEDINSLLLPLGDSTVLEQTIQRMRSAKWGALFTLLTTLSDEDAPIRQFCLQRNIPYIAHKTSNPLEALYHTAHAFSADIVVRCFANQTLISPRMLDACASWAISSQMDYVTVSRLPVGLPAEAFPIRTLNQLLHNKQAQETNLVALRSANFDCALLPSPLHWRRPELRLTLDSPADYKVFQQIYTEVPRRENGLHRYEDVLAYLDKNPLLRSHLSDDYAIANAA